MSKMGQTPKPHGKNSQPSPAPAPDSRVRCLLVEDERVMRELFQYRMSTDPRFTFVDVAGSAEEAIEKCAKLKPALVVTDLILPEMTGLELIRHLLRDHPQLRILALSADERPEILREAMAAGVHGFVAKSSSWQAVHHALVEVSEGRTTICPISSELLRLAAQSPSPQQAPLSERERELLSAFASGKSIKEIADHLDISAKTAYNHFTNLKNKLGIYDPVGLIQYAQQVGLAPSTRRKTRFLPPPSL